MTATPAPRPYQVGDRVQVERHGQLVPGRISAIRPSGRGTEYVIRTDPADGGMGDVLNVWSTSAHPSYLLPIADRGRP
jgi:hypothetical protein